MSDDNDVDMSLFFTVEMGNALVMIMPMSEGIISRSKFAGACCDGFDLPHGGGWLEGCVEVL